jgi:hypothetical protein
MQIPSIHTRRSASRGKLQERISYLRGIPALSIKPKVVALLGGEKKTQLFIALGENPEFDYIISDFVKIKREVSNKC